MFAQLFLNKMSNQTICTNYTLISMLFFISYVHENVLHMDPLLINCIKTLIYYKRIDKKNCIHHDAIFQTEKVFEVCISYSCLIKFVFIIEFGLKCGNPNPISCIQPEYIHSAR